MAQGDTIAGVMRLMVAPAALSLGLLVATLVAGMPPSAAGPIAALFPPWWDGARSMRAAAVAGAVVRFGAAPFIVVVAPDTADAAARLRRAGAWLSLDPLVLGGCGG